MSDQHHPKVAKFTFAQFLKKFPEVELPITFTDETLQAFSRTNDPLPAAMIHQFMGEEKNVEESEFVEYVACCRLPKTYDIHAVVFWKADLMNYEFTLATFDKKGRSIQKKVIAGTKLEQDLLVRSVATIDADWTIYVVGGIADKNGNNFDPSSSKSLRLELLADGEIVALPDFLDE